MSITFWNVSIVNNREDNGYCVTFTDRESALACADHARSAGAWSVTVWK